MRLCVVLFIRGVFHMGVCRPLIGERIRRRQHRGTDMKDSTVARLFCFLLILSTTVAVIPANAADADVEPLATSGRQTTPTGQAYQWLNGLGSSENDYARHVKASSDGSVYVAGDYCTSSDSNCQFYLGDQSSNSAATLQGDNSCEEVFIAKYGPDGTLEWEERVHNSHSCGSGRVYVTDLDLMSDGSAVISGWYRYTAYFGSLSIQDNSGDSHYDGFVAKIGPTGVWEWAHSMGSDGTCCSDSYARGVAVDPSNDDVYVAGYWYHTTHSFQISNNNYMNGQCGNWIWTGFVVKFNKQGTYQWVEENKGWRRTTDNYCSNDHRNEIWDIIVDNQSNFYFVGLHYGEGTQGCFEFNGHRTCRNNGYGWDWNMFIVKVNSQKTVQWGKSVGLNDADYIREVVLDQYQNPIVRGYKTGGNSYTFGQSTVPSGAGTFVAKWNASGTEEWYKRLSDCCHDPDQRDGGMAVDPDGNVHVVYGSHRTETVSYDGMRLYDYVSDTRDDGNRQYYTFSIDIDDNGTVYRTGIVDGSMNLYGQTTTNRGNWDGWVSKFDPDEDGDGIADRLDNCRLIPNYDQENHDQDANGNACDDDDDNDGTPDELDDCPRGDVGWGPSVASTDFDGDGCYDLNEDNDDDNDGISDRDDSCDPDALADDPRDPMVQSGYSLWKTDWNSTPENDHDRDGCHDASFEEKDGDNDGVFDLIDACKYGNIEWGANNDPVRGDITDHDSDGCEDRTEEDPDRDNDGVIDWPDIDARDSCPMGQVGVLSTPLNDHDADGCLDGDDEGDGEDSDNDGDGVLNTDDYCMNGLRGWQSTWETDHDGDGCRNNEEDDDNDDDNVPNAVDQCPLGATGFKSKVTNDWDSDGCHDDTEDDDDDNDRIMDFDDFCPTGRKDWVSGRVKDRDGDGCRDDDEDVDDDADGICDGQDVDQNQDCEVSSKNSDLCPYSRIEWYSTPASDRDRDGCHDDEEDDDDDNDGLNDYVDDCPYGDVNCRQVPGESDDTTDQQTDTTPGDQVNVSTDAGNVSENTTSESENVLDNASNDDASNTTGTLAAASSDTSSSNFTIFYITGGVMAFLALLGVLLSRKGSGGSGGEEWMNEYSGGPDASGFGFEAPPPHVRGQTGDDGHEWVEYPPGSNRHWYRPGPGANWMPWA